MEHTHTAGNAHTSAVISIVTAAMSFVDAGEVMKLLAGVISIVTGIMAIRYYYHATKNIKK